MRFLVGLFFVFFLSCSEWKNEPIVILYKDSSYDKALNDSIKMNVEKGIIGKKPLVVINGVIYAQQNTKDTILLPIEKEIDPIFTFLKKDVALEIYPNEGSEGIILFNYNR